MQLYFSRLEEFIKCLYHQLKRLVLVLIMQYVLINLHTNKIYSYNRMANASISLLHRSFPVRLHSSDTRRSRTVAGLQCSLVAPFSTKCPVFVFFCSVNFRKVLSNGWPQMGRCGFHGLSWCPPQACFTDFSVGQRVSAYQYLAELVQELLECSVGTFWEVL